MKRQSQTYGMKEKWCKMEVYSNKTFPRETRKTQINNIILHLKQLEKEEETKPKVRIREKSQRSKQKEIKLTPRNGRSK